MSRDELEANCNYYRHEMIKWRKRACHMIQEYETLEKEYEHNLLLTITPTTRLVLGVIKMKIVMMMIMNTITNMTGN